MLEYDLFCFDLFHTLVKGPSPEKIHEWLLKNNPFGITDSTHYWLEAPFPPAIFFTSTISLKLILEDCLTKNFGSIEDLLHKHGIHSIEKNKLDFFYKYVDWLDQHTVFIEPMKKIIFSLISKRKKIVFISNLSFIHSRVADYISKSFPNIPMVLSYKVGYKKPDTRIFKAGADLMGHKPKKICMIGDSWKSDIRGSTSIGWDAVFYDRTHDHPVSYVIANGFKGMVKVMERGYRVIDTFEPFLMSHFPECIRNDGTVDETTCFESSESIFPTICKRVYLFNDFFKCCK